VTDETGGAGLPPSITEAADALRRGTVTAVELTEAALARADALDGELGVYLARFDERALASAARADADLAAGVDRGPLQGIPLGIKDIIAAAEGPTTAQSLVLDRAWGQGRDAPVVSRLRAAGAVITGKVSTMEFACGVPDTTKPFPLPRNPWDTSTWPGGSSSGTGVGVAAGMFLGGLGTDTGGSIRFPAACCGVSGLKPTYGRVPKSGCVPLGYTLDHIGPLARSAADCALILQAIAGYDPSDPTCVDIPVPDFSARQSGSLAGVSIGVDRVNHLPRGADPALAGTLDDAVAALGGLGASIVEVALPFYREMVLVNLITTAAEAYAYHRNDLQQRWGDFFAGTRAMVIGGVLVDAADYVQAQRLRRVAQQALARLLKEVDVVIMPTAATGAFSYEAILGRPLDLPALFENMFTPYWDSQGNPVLAVPIGFTDGRLPLSMQIAGRPFEEALVVAVGDAYQQRTDWHLQLPPMIEAAGQGKVAGSAVSAADAHGDRGGTS
jgi:aspartyl-tRNA(Asn)/glutamyl-tRNA(Gln) amidotransferase subunit A